MCNREMYLEKQQENIFYVIHFVSFVFGKSFKSSISLLPQRQLFLSPVGCSTQDSEMYFQRRSQCP